MNYKKFKPELTDREVDDLEKGGDTDASRDEDQMEEAKTQAASKVIIMQINGKREEFECDLETTKVKDVISQVFKNQVADGK